jgi:hypothetical protein
MFRFVPRHADSFVTAVVPLILSSSLYVEIVLVMLEMEVHFNISYQPCKNTNSLH